MPELSIREASPGDVPALLRLAEESNAFHATGAPDIWRTETGGTRAPFEDAMADPESAVFVAEVDGVVVGVLVASVQTLGDKGPLAPRRFVHVSELAVTEHARRGGVGRRLMKRVERWARSRGLNRIELSVAGFNGEASAFYDGLGYATVTRRLFKVLPDG